MEQTIKIAIYIHAFFGGLGLITGIIGLIVKKGSPIHKRMGKLFSIGMLTSSLISLPIAYMPNHENLFLFLIGIFTIYLVLTGNRALTFKSKSKEKPDKKDYSISYIMLFCSIIMVVLGAYGMITKVANSILYLFFGGFGLLLVRIDFRFFKNYIEDKNAWIVNHIRKMVGAFIASITAFIVAGLGIGNLIAWIAPSVLGTIYIIYWRRKVTPKEKSVPS